MTNTLIFFAEKMRVSFALHFPAYKSPSEKGTSLRENNLFLKGETSNLLE